MDLNATNVLLGTTTCTQDFNFIVIGGRILTSIYGKTVNYLVVFRISESKTV